MNCVIGLLKPPTPRMVAVTVNFAHFSQFALGLVFGIIEKGGPNLN